jgi:hypothetical protein
MRCFILLAAFIVLMPDSSHAATDLFAGMRNSFSGGTADQACPKHTGEISTPVRINGPSDMFAEYGAVPLKAGKEYELKAYLRTTNVTGKAYLYSAIRSTYYGDISDDWHGVLYGTKDWTLISFKWRMIESVTPAYMGVRIDSGTAWVGDIYLYETDGNGISVPTNAPPAPTMGEYSPAGPSPTEYDTYGGWKGLQGTQTGFFHPQQINGKWWFITPEGNAYWLVGISCVTYEWSNMHDYNAAIVAKYPSDTRNRFKQSAHDRMKGWYDNCIEWYAGTWIGASVTQKLPYTIAFDCRNQLPHLNTLSSFPNVFHPQWKTNVESHIATTVAAFGSANDTYCIGYLTADEPPFYGSRIRYLSVVDDVLAQPSSDPAKAAFRDFMSARYGANLNSLRTAWGPIASGFSAWDDLKNMTNLPEHSSYPARETDKSAFLQKIAEEMGRIPHEAIKKVDTNHIDFGFVPTRYWPEVITGLGEYADVMSFNAYDWNSGYEVNPDYGQTITNLYALGHKPITSGITAAARDATDFAKPNYMKPTVYNQIDKGESYKRYLRTAAENPYHIGLTWFAWVDPDPTDGEAGSNWGVVNTSDNVYFDLVKAMAEANAQVYAWRTNSAGSGFTAHGTPHVWLDSYGLTNYEVDDTSDPDHDGMLTWQEYIAGTNPTNRTSFFHVFEQGCLNKSNYIKWIGTTNSGVTSNFGIKRSTNLQSPWGPCYATAPRSPTGTNLWWDTNAPSAGTPTFYRPIATN